MAWDSEGAWVLGLSVDFRSRNGAVPAGLNATKRGCNENVPQTTWLQHTLSEDPKEDEGSSCMDVYRQDNGRG